MTNMFATQTLAELYENQGVYDKAAEVYRALSAEFSDRDDLKEKLKYLENQLDEKAQAESLISDKRTELVSEVPEAEETDTAIISDAHELEEIQDIEISAEVEQISEPVKAVKKEFDTNSGKKPLYSLFKEWLELLRLQKSISLLEKIKKA